MQNKIAARLNSLNKFANLDYRSSFSTARIFTSDHNSLFFT
jgi:hypothetical protein